MSTRTRTRGHPLTVGVNRLRRALGAAVAWGDHRPTTAARSGGTGPTVRGPAPAVRR